MLIRARLEDLVGDRRGWMEERPQSSADTAIERRGFHPDHSNLHRMECTHPGKADGGGLRVKSTMVR